MICQYTIWFLYKRRQNLQILGSYIDYMWFSTWSYHPWTMDATKEKRQRMWPLVGSRVPFLEGRRIHKNMVISILNLFWAQLQYGIS